MIDSVNMKPERVAAVRRFNRFYTRQIGLLEEKLLHSAYSLTEVRVLYEVAHAPGTTATDLTKSLGLDAGYASRILRKFEQDGLVRRAVSDQDARKTTLELTAKGRKTFEPLSAASDAQVADLLAALPDAEQERLVSAMTSIEDVLVPPAPEPFVLRPPHVGDMGWVIQRHGVLYHQEYGWNAEFEGLVAEICATFVKSKDPRREHCFIAERAGFPVGSAFVMKDSAEVARLRLLLVEPTARGSGIGDRLVAECIRFARNAGYRDMVLWTNDILVSARKIYEAHGFRLVKEKRHHSFGKDLVGQDWELELFR